MVSAAGHVAMLLSVDMQAVMADELGHLRMQLQLEREALEHARTQRAADRSAQRSSSQRVCHSTALKCSVLMLHACVASVQVPTQHAKLTFSLFGCMAPNS